MRDTAKTPCRYYEHWRENQSPFGSNEYWYVDMHDCAHPGFDDKQKQIEFEGWGHCDETCPGYQPEELSICPKHGRFVKKYGCDNCMIDAMKGTIQE